MDQKYQNPKNWSQNLNPMEIGVKNIELGSKSGVQKNYFLSWGQKIKPASKSGIKTTEYAILIYI